MYVNFNFLRLSCPRCQADLVDNQFLRKLSENIKRDCKYFKKNETLLLNYKLCCYKCNYNFRRNFEIERTKRILIAI